jgi:hypothetical protein
MVDILCYDSSISAMIFGGGARGCMRGWLGKVVFVPFFFFCNSYVNCSVELCMYVDDTKFELTPYPESM